MRWRSSEHNFLDIKIPYLLSSDLDMDKNYQQEQNTCRDDFTKDYYSFLCHIALGYPFTLVFTEYKPQEPLEVEGH